MNIQTPEVTQGRVGALGFSGPLRELEAVLEIAAVPPSVAELTIPPSHAHSPIAASSAADGTADRPLQPRAAGLLRDSVLPSLSSCDGHWSQRSTGGELR